MGRRDEVGKTGIYPATGPYPDGDMDILTPGEINRGSDTGGSAVGQSDDLKNAERLPRKGDDFEGQPDSDALGG